MPSGRKRAAGHNGETSTGGTSKKTRFVEPEDDTTNFAEQVDSALEKPSRKGKVKNEGYDSDSSDDGEGVVNSRKKGGGDVDGDDDMFAMDDKKQDEEDGGKKREQYMRLGDIEGQEFGRQSGSGESDEDSDEPEDEDDAERRKKAGMGFELSSFNMRDEMEEGKFTEDGSYVRTFDPHAVHDRWMEGLDEREIKLARKRKRAQEKMQKERMEAEEKELKESGGKSNMEKELLSMLKKGETVLEALQRLGAQARKNQARNKGTKQRTTPHDAMNLDEISKPTAIEQITHLASNLMSLGDTDIYSKNYEELVRGVRSSGSVPASWEPPSADLKYEYKWDVPGEGQTTDPFGPFSEQEMNVWLQASYFGPSGEKVKVRRVGGEWGEWDDIIQ